jgi:uncharacterized cofD-like protein
LIDRIAAEIADSSAVKMYICNVMTQPGETQNMSASQHVQTLLENAGARVCDYVLVNDEAPSKLLGAYAEEGQVPVVPDVGAIEALGLTVIRAQVISETETVRHDPEKLADVVCATIDQAVADRATLVRPATAYKR